MWPYWLMFLVPAAAAVLSKSSGQPAHGRLPTANSTHFGWLAAGTALTLLVGYRTQVGGDWFTYLELLEDLRGLPIQEVLLTQDPAYSLAAWISAEMGWDIYGVNLFCAAIFSFGLVRFCRELPRPWLALAVAVPYLVIVVGMGYTRQAVALGCAMLAVRSLRHRSVGRFLLWALFGAAFHRSAVLLLPIAALVNSRNRWWIILWVGVITAGAYTLLLSDSVDILYANYITAEYQSQGAVIRLLMNGVPAVLLLWKRDRFAMSHADAKLWRWFAIISLVLVFALLTTNATTALDRLGLYMLPLQMVVFSHLPGVMANSGRRSQGWVYIVVLYYSAVLFVWLNFAAHSGAWVPYRLYWPPLLE